MRKGSVIVLCVIVLAGCGCARLPSMPGEYAVSVQTMETDDGELHATYVRPVQPRHPGHLVVFATGDAGWLGASGAVFRHLAEQGYTIAGFSAPEALEPIKRSGQRVSTAQAALGLKELYARAKRDLRLPDSTPIIIVGFSRGATAVAFTALHPELRGGVEGAVAIALTREADYLRAPEGERRPELQVDDQGRIQTYPALKLLGSTRLAVIQSTNDPYVPAAESRQLLGPDTPTLRLYAVEARNHGFSNARDKLMQDLDDALQWIEESAAPSRAAVGANGPGVIGTQHRVPGEDVSTSFPQHTCKPDAEPVRISDGEITQTIIAIGNWNDDLCADFVHELPVFVDVGDHHSDVSDWKRWSYGQSRATRVAECGELGKKKAVIFPG